MRHLGTLIVALTSFTAFAAEPQSANVPSIEPASQLKLQLNWPGAVNREAYVILEFDVLANGKAANIGLIDDGFHEKRFVDAAMNALKKSEWRPRRVNGQAVDSHGLRQAFRFGIPDIEPGVTDEFRSEAVKVEDLLRKGDYAGGEFHAQWMLVEKVTFNYEYAVLQAQLAQTYVGLGRLEDAVRKLERATARSDARPQFLQLLDTPPPNKASNYLLSKKELVVQLLTLRMRVLAAQGFALEAMQAYYELAGLEPLPADDPRAVLAAELATSIRGPEGLRGKVEIGPAGGWQQFLSRRRFVLEKVRGGSIDALHVVCSTTSRELVYVPGEEWTVPEEAGLCKAIIRAEQGTRFDIVELPDA